MQLFRVKSSALQALQVSNIYPSVNSDPTRDANSGVPMGWGGGGGGSRASGTFPYPHPVFSLGLNQLSLRF